MKILKILIYFNLLACKIFWASKNLSSPTLAHVWKYLNVKP